jgi:hypothetical protein
MISRDVAACGRARAEGEGQMTLPSEMQYPHWLMVAGATLVGLGFASVAFRQNSNAESDREPKGK